MRVFATVFSKPFESVERLPFDGRLIDGGNDLIVTKKENLTFNNRVRGPQRTRYLISSMITQMLIASRSLT